MQSDILELKQIIKQLVEKDASNTYTVTETTDNLSQLVTNVNTISKDVGATGKLTTTQDSDIVGAINELDAEIGSVTLTTTAQTLTGAIQEIFQGGFEELDLTLDSVKSSTGLALGGFSDSERSSLGKDLTHCQEIYKYLTLIWLVYSEETLEIVEAIDLLTTTAKTILGGVNELDGEIGTLSSLTTGNKSTIVASINELDSDLGALTSLSSEVRDSNVAQSMH